MRSPHRNPAGLDRQPEPRPKLIQLLTPEGERVEHPDYPLDLTTDEVKALYRDLVLVRRIDTEAIALQRQGELGIWASLLGQEAAQVGSGRALGPRDMAFPTYREHGVAWCRGLDPPELLELFRGVSHGGWDPHEHKFHLYTIVIGAQTLHATGYAMGIQRDGAVGEDGEAAIVYFGDGATSQGDVNEAFIWASVFNAPVVFFCQNNQWAISEPLERQSRIPLYQRASGFGFPGVRVDGNDVLACLAVTRKAHAGRPRGPGPDADRGLHLPDGRAHHHRRPHPVPARQRARGVEAEGPDRAGQGLPGPHRARPTRRSSTRSTPRPTQLGGRLRQACLEMPDPEPLSMFDNVYAEPTALLRRGARAVRGLPRLVRRGGGRDDAS